MTANASRSRNLLASLLLAAFTIFAATVATAAPAKAPPAIPTYDHVDNGGVSSYTLANGFKVILVPYPSAGQVRVSLVIRSGSKVEGYGESGMAHLLEHMIFLGAGQRKSVKDDLTRLNASWNGTTSADRTNYFATLPADQKKLEELIRITADMFLDPRFTEEDLRREMTVVRNEMEMGENSAGSLATKALMRQAFFWHGYGRATIGARSDVEKAPFQALKDFHRRHYRPDNAFLVVAGTFERQPTVELINRLFATAKNPPLPKPANWTREELQPLNSRSEVFLPTGSTMATSAWKLPPSINRETTAFQLAATAICSSEWGLLRQRLVVERKLATAASCGTNTMREATLFVAMAGGSKDDDPEAMRAAAVTTIEEAAARGITREQLERSRTEAVNGLDRIVLSMEAFAGALEGNEVDDDWRRFFVDRDIVREVTLDEANAALRKWITPLGRSDVLVRHRDKVDLPRLPEIEPTAPLAAGKTWPAVTTEITRKPASWEEFKAAVQYLDLDGGGSAANVKGALIQRRTNGDRVWLQLRNRYGNADYRRENGLACAVASGLFAYGGAGLDENALDARMVALDANWSIGPEGITLSTKKANLEAALDTLIKVWLDPLLPAGEFARIKEQMIAGLDAGLTNPAVVADKEADFRFDNYPAGHPAKPKTFDTLREERKQLRYEQVRSCAEDTRGLADALLVATGDLSREEFVRLWETRFKPLPRSRLAYERTRVPQPPERIDTRDIVVAMPNKPNATITAQGIVPVVQGDADLPALRLAFLALGDGANSRLFRRLREKEGLSYSVDASISPNPFDRRTPWFISATVASPDYQKALAALRDELARVIRDGFTDAEVAQAKSSWLEARKNGFTAEAGYTSRVAGLLDSETSFDFLIDYDKRIAALSAAEVNATFRKYVSADKMVWAAGVGSQ